MATLHTDEYDAMVGRLRQAREEAGMTQEEVADVFHRPQSFMSKIEAGERRIDPIELCHLAELYKKPVEWFLPVDCGN